MCAVSNIALTLSIPKTVCVYNCRIYLCNSLQCTYLVCAVTMVSVTSLDLIVMEYCIVCFMSVVVTSHLMVHCQVIVAATFHCVSFTYTETYLRIVWNGGGSFACKF